MKRSHFKSILFFKVLLLTAGSACAFASASDGSQQPQSTAFSQGLAAARIAYFKDLEGDHAAHQDARQQFAALAQKSPGDPVVQAYIGSLDLLDAARTWAFWNKHTLSQQGLHELDHAVDQDPSSLEARFIRAATTWHLPFFFHRREQAEADFAYIAPRAVEAVSKGTLPPQLGAAALDYHGQVLSEKSDRAGARSAFEAAVQLDQSSPGGRDALRRLRE